MQQINIKFLLPSKKIEENLNQTKRLLTNALAPSLFTEWISCIILKF